MVNKYNEIQLANYIIDNGFSSSSRMYELSVVARYLYWNGLDKDEIQNYIVKFCNRYFENFNEIKYFDLISRIVSGCDSRTPIEIGSIKIYKSQLDFINKYTPFEVRKLIFGIIVIDKINRISYNSRYINQKWSYLASMSNIKNPRSISKMLKHISDLGLIRLSYNGSIECLFDIEESGEVCFEIFNFDKSGLYYINHISGGYSVCKECGAIFKKTRGRYQCEECSQNKKLEYQKRYHKEYYENQKDFSNKVLGIKTPIK